MYLYMVDFDINRMKWETIVKENGKHTEKYRIKEKLISIQKE